LGLAIIIAVVVLVLLITYVLFRLSKQLADAFGQTGVNVITRVLGVLLSALAVQYVTSGVTVVLQNAISSP
jgi:multiple antibiotic resistance protein